ncbi:hypothetical protein L2E82_07678 [Cichorium intybus]|uniref:Uncharacterized protein n=1 Tax=Cichorium intybus TaxID=13427 RepID=A0ACB9G5V3_CICIN|nr:hypothetical protein L2E82_07678 [Cichorium intybus]
MSMDIFLSTLIHPSTSSTAPISQMTILIAASNFTTKISKFLRFRYALYSNLPDPPRNPERSSKKYNPHSDDLAFTVIDGLFKDEQFDSRRVYL